MRRISKSKGHRAKGRGQRAKGKKQRVTFFNSLHLALCSMLFCLGVFFASGSVSYAAKEAQGENLPIEASAAVDKSSIQIGDKIIYTITVKARNDIEVEFSQILPENLAGFAIKDFGSSQKGLFGKKTFKQWYLLDTYVSGEHAIPAAVVKYRTKGQTDWQELSVNEVKLEVKSVLDNAPNRADIRDIRGPKSFASKIWLYILIVVAVLLIFVAAFGFILLKKKKEESKAPPTPAHIIAYEALAALEKKDYIRKGQTKAYYIELSDIVRHYLENRFNIRAPEMTTEEFLIKVKEDATVQPLEVTVSLRGATATKQSLRLLRSLRSLAMTPRRSLPKAELLQEDSTLSLEHKGLLRDFLTNCDLVKFAKYQPAQTEADLSLESAKRLIDQTKGHRA